jgi:DNA-binding response OmpR family regulator
MHVLVLEDEDAIRIALVRALTRDGHRVDGAGSLAEARALLTAGRPEVLISDGKLPDGSGLEFARELAVPFMMMTGYGTFDDAVTALRLGALDFFTKPVPIRDLRRALERVPRDGGRSGPMILDPAGPAYVRPYGDWVHAEVVETATARWANPAEAQAAFANLRPHAPSPRHRLALAELMQATPAARVVINHGEERWSAWLDAGDVSIPWANQPERTQVIEGLATACRWLSAGAMVECGRG